MEMILGPLITAATVWGLISLVRWAGRNAHRPWVRNAAHIAAGVALMSEIKKFHSHRKD